MVIGISSPPLARRSVILSALRMPGFSGLSNTRCSPPATHCEEGARSSPANHISYSPFQSVGDVEVLWMVAFTGEPRESLALTQDSLYQKLGAEQGGRSFPAAINWRHESGDPHAGPSNRIPPIT